MPRKNAAKAPEKPAVALSVRDMDPSEVERQRRLHEAARRGDLDAFYAERDGKA